MCTCFSCLIFKHTFIMNASDKCVFSPCQNGMKGIFIQTPRCDVLTFNSYTTKSPSQRELKWMPPISHYSVS